MDKEFNLVAAIRIILKWKTPLLVLTLASGIIAGLFSVFVMDEYYLSWSTFYPTNQYLSDRSMIFNTESSGGQVEYFGGKSDINRVLTIANSETVINFIIDSFNLTDHYKVSRNNKFYKTIVRKQFEKNYKALKTEREAIEISIYDTDPKLAAAMVNVIIEKVDELNMRHVLETKEKLYQVLSAQIEQQREKVNDYVTTLATLATEFDIKVSSAAGSTVLVEGKNFRAVQEYKAMLEKQENAMKEFNNRSNIKEQMEVAMQSISSSLFIVEKAFPADRRDKPVRSLVVLITMLVTAFVSTIGVFLIEQFKELKAQL
ncbi:MAG: hypothetical protein IPP77_12225 [Bacteroidetes bacterium]|nr:hypothetical protein [Bacteroidota bacterium]